jgi:hypothetical protein
MHSGARIDVPPAKPWREAESFRNQSELSALPVLQLFLEASNLGADRAAIFAAAAGPPPFPEETPGQIRHSESDKDEGNDGLKGCGHQELAQDTRKTRKENQTMRQQEVA